MVEIVTRGVGMGLVGCFVLETGVNLFGSSGQMVVGGELWRD